MLNKLRFFSLLVCTLFHGYTCNVRVGPDPWDYVADQTESEVKNNLETPPDLRIPLKRKLPSDGNLGSGEWFFKRTLAIVLNGGQIQVNEDGSINVLLQMKFDQNRWETLNEYVKSNVALTEDMFRRSTGYIEEAIYKPTVTEKIAIAWSEYIQFYLIEYKFYLTWCSGICAAVALFLWVWRHMSHKHVLIMIFIGLYLYEVIISYKEAEQNDLERFKSAINKCSWQFWNWRSTCDVSPPNPLIFMKHMNPLKILIRMFATLISEPMIALSTAVNTMVHGMTDGLWFPFDKIIHGCLILCINVLLIFLLIMVTFNYLLNIPFNLSLLGLVNVGVKQRKRSFNFNASDNTTQYHDNTDRISGATLNRLLDVCSRALDSSQNSRQNANVETSNLGINVPKLKRSASTGRLPSNLESRDILAIANNFKRRPNAWFMKKRGGGDGKHQHTKKNN